MRETSKETPKASRKKLPDDLLVLDQLYHLGPLSYVDFFQLEQMKEMMSKWSLIHELAEGKKDEQGGLIKE